MSPTVFEYVLDFQHHDIPGLYCVFPEINDFSSDPWSGKNTLENTLDSTQRKLLKLPREGGNLPSFRGICQPVYQHSYQYKFFKCHIIRLGLQKE